MTNAVYQTPDYKRSRAAYCMQAAFEYFIAILVSDAYLAKLLTHIGLDDALIGIIASFISAAFLFQLTAVFCVQRIKNIKRTVIFFNILGCVLFSGLYLIPFLPGSVAFKSVLVVVCLLLAYFGNYFVASMLFKWANSFVDPKKRGEYSAAKEMISLLSGMVFTLIVGMLIDRFEALDRLTAGFLFIACAGLILSVCCLICLLMIRGDIRRAEDPSAAASSSASAPRHTLREVFANTLGNRSFVNVVILMSLWNIAQYLTVGFLGTFKTTDLLLSVGTIQLINIGSNLVRFCISKPFGRYSDKTSYARGMQLAMIISACGYFANVFTTKSTWWFIIIYTVLHNSSAAGTNQNSYNILYSYVDADYFVEAMAIKNSIAGVLGFAASLVGAKLLSLVQANGNMLFGIPLYGQQLLSLLSTALAIVCIVFLRRVIDKQAVMKQ
ncbi:MAG: MFS transporter [Clostridia bacterium]|nr:MFS transporter [Clostridia bacterium]